MAHDLTQSGDHSATSPAEATHGRAADPSQVVPSATMDSFDWTLPAPSVVDTAAADVCNKLRGIGLSDDALDSVHGAVQEVVSALATGAGAGVPSDLRDAYLRLKRVADDNIGFPECVEASKAFSQVAYDAIGRMLDAAPPRSAAVAGSGPDTQDTTWFWEIVDRAGLADVPSDERGALALLCQRAAPPDPDRAGSAGREEALEPLILAYLDAMVRRARPDRSADSFHHLREAIEVVRGEIADPARAGRRFREEMRAGSVLGHAVVYDPAPTIQLPDHVAALRGQAYRRAGSAGREEVETDDARARRYVVELLASWARAPALPVEMEVALANIEYAFGPEGDSVAALRTGPGAPRDGVADLSRAARDVLAERRRQVEAHEWASHHSRGQAGGEIAQAAASYAMRAHAGRKVNLRPPSSWPWDYRWWAPGKPRHNLVEAGALILGEIERLDRDTRIADAPGRGE